MSYQLPEPGFRFQCYTETQIRQSYQAGRKEGYLIGFMASAEGDNGEYPFRDHGINPEEDVHWLQKRGEKLK